jgi:hypothetical protein
LFPPGKSVHVAWDIDPAFSSSPGDFYGVVDHYDKHGYLTAYSNDGVRLWIPCGMAKMRAA